KRIVRTIVNAVETHETLALPQIALRVRCALTALQAQIAVSAAHRIPVDPPERKSAEDSEQSPQWADDPAEEPRNPPVRHQETNENQPDKPRLPVLARLGVNTFGRLVHRGQNTRGHRANRQRDRIQKPNLQRAVGSLMLLSRSRDSRLDRSNYPRKPRLTQLGPLIGPPDLRRCIDRGGNDPQARHRNH